MNVPRLEARVKITHFKHIEMLEILKAGNTDSDLQYKQLLISNWNIGNWFIVGFEQEEVLLRIVFKAPIKLSMCVFQL